MLYADGARCNILDLAQVSHFSLTNFVPLSLKYERAWLHETLQCLQTLIWSTWNAALETVKPDLFSTGNKNGTTMYELSCVCLTQASYHRVIHSFNIHFVPISGLKEYRECRLSAAWTTAVPSSSMQMLNLTLGKLFIPIRVFCGGEGYTTTDCIWTSQFHLQSGLHCYNHQSPSATDVQPDARGARDIDCWRATTDHQATLLEQSQNWKRKQKNIHQSK